jgi:tetratricopeptide (TPR) repeat protein
MQTTPSAPVRGRARILAAALLATPLALPLGACAQERTPPSRTLAQALEANLNPGPGGGPVLDGGSAAGDYLVGEFALGAGDYRAAADSLDRALAADPQDIELRRQVFLLRLADGDYDRAVATAKSLVEADPNADEPLLLLAADRARAGQWAAAHDLLQKVSGRGAVGLVAPVLDAWARFGAGNVDAALARLGSQGPDQGLDLLRRYHHALMLELAHRPAEALPLLADVEKRPGGLPLRITQTLAQVRLDTGDRAGAEKVVADALAADPEDPRLVALRDKLQKGERLVPIADAASAMADALVGVADALLDQQATAQALLLGRDAAYVAPGMADAQLLVGRILLDQKSPEEAVGVLEKVPDSSPQSWTARLLRAQALRDQGKTDEAAGLLKAMVAERPHRTDAAIALGDLYRHAERYADAEAAYGEAIARLGKPAPDDWRLFYARGMALERLNRWPEAEASLKKALELQPDQPLVLNYLGYSWVDRGENLDQAQGMLKRAVELKPDDGYIVDSLGWAYFRLGQYDKAVTYLERAAEIEPGDATINDHLGDAYWRAGRQREARFQWRQALAFKPEPAQKGQIEAKLEKGLPQVGQPGQPAATRG